MVIKELGQSDRVNQSLASIVLSAAASRKRDRCDAPESIGSSAANNDDDDQDYSFRSKKRVNSSIFSMPAAAVFSERREDISDDNDEELEDLMLMYRTTVFREQRQLPKTPYSMHCFNDEEEDEDGLSPSFVGAHPTILRAKTINEDSSTDYIDPPEMSSRTHHTTHEGQDLLFSEKDETSNESYESRGAGEDSVSEREQPEWLSGSARPFAWTLPKKGTEPLFTSVQREISNRK
jgi:hypothetical protein